jgi:hypothetical protein
MLLLASIDLTATFAAKEAVERGSVQMALIGIGLFVLLFWVLASALHYADLAPVTLGWVVVLQVGVLLLDRIRYGVELSTGQWVAVVVILAAQVYLLLGPDRAATPTAPVARAVAEDVSGGGVVPREGGLHR